MARPRAPPRARRARPATARPAQGVRRRADRAGPRAATPPHLTPQRLAPADVPEPVRTPGWRRAGRTGVRPPPFWTLDLDAPERAWRDVRRSLRFWTPDLPSAIGDRIDTFREHRCTHWCGHATAWHARADAPLGGHRRCRDRR